jgi:hypothetical protein
MAYTLKTTGIATKLIAAIGVDEDGTTVKDFVTGNTGTYNASIGSPRIGTATWKGVTRSHFKTDIGADAYSPRGWVWSGTPPTVPMNGGNGVAFLALVNAFDDVGVGNVFWTVDSNNSGVRIGTGAKIEAWMGSSSRGFSTTTLTTATKCSFGLKQIYNTNSLPFYYGLESGSLAEDGTYNEGGYSGQGPLQEFGGNTGFESAPGQYFLALWFSHATLPTTAELQALHDDPWGTLFDLPITGDFASTMGAMAMEAAGTHITPITSDVASTMGAMVMAAQGTVNVAPKQLIFSAGAGTLFRDKNQALVTANNVGYAWYDSTSVTALGTVKDWGTFNITAGVATLTLSGTSLVAGQTGTLLVKLGTAKQYIEMAIT